MHTPFQLKELYMCENIWPVGERAANERSVMNALLIGNSMSGDKGAADEAFKVYDSLTGVADPESRKVHVKTQEQIDMEMKFLLRSMAT